MTVFTGTNNNDTITPTAVSPGVTPAGEFPNNDPDTLFGLGGNDTLDGGGGADSISGGGGNDTIRLGRDVAFTGSRDVILDVGVVQTVTLTDASGTSDTVDGGAGFDRILLNREGGTGFIADYQNAPSLLSRVELIIGTDGDDLITLPTTYTNGARIEGREGHDVLVGSDNRSDTILGGSGDDTVAGRGGNDRLAGNAGADEVWGGSGGDTITLGRDVAFTGSRTLVVDGVETRTVTLNDASGTSDDVDGGAGIDRIVLNPEGGTGFIADYQTAPGLVEDVESFLGTSGRDVIALPLTYSGAAGGAVDIIGLGGNDTLVGSNTTRDNILGGGGRDLLAGLAGNDRLVGGARGDELLGGDDNDSLVGGSGDDSLDGGAGNDLLRGGAGLDNLDGEGGDDTYDFNRVSESTPGNPDFIGSFDVVGINPGDVIDVSGIDADTTIGGNQSFIFTGTTASAQPRSLWVQDDPSSDHTFVFGNTNNSAAPELRIIVDDDAAVATQWHDFDFDL